MPKQSNDGTPVANHLNEIAAESEKESANLQTLQGLHARAEALGDVEGVKRHSAAIKASIQRIAELREEDATVRPALKFEENRSKLARLPELIQGHDDAASAYEAATKRFAEADAELRAAEANLVRAKAEKEHLWVQYASLKDSCDKFAAAHADVMGSE